MSDCNHQIPKDDIDEAIEKRRGFHWHCDECDSSITIYWPKHGCEWELYLKASSHDAYKTSCGEVVDMAHDDRPDESFSYCPHCGEELVQRQ